MSKRNQRYQAEAVADAPVQVPGLADLVAAWRAEADDKQRLASHYKSSCADHQLQRSGYNQSAIVLRRLANQVEAVINGPTNAAPAPDEAGAVVEAESADDGHAQEGVAEG